MKNNTDSRSILFDFWKAYQNKDADKRDRAIEKAVSEIDELLTQQKRKEKKEEKEKEHDFRFSHYEMGDTNSTYLQKFAVMICKNCGQYLKQQCF